MATTVLGGGLALLVLAMPQPMGPIPQLFPEQDFDLGSIASDETAVASLEIFTIDPAKDGVKGGQWDELPPTKWTYQTGEFGPAIELGTGGGKLQPLRVNRPKQRDGKLAHLTIGWDF